MSGGVCLSESRSECKGLKILYKERLTNDYTFKNIKLNIFEKY